MIRNISKLVKTIATHLLSLMGSAYWLDYGESLRREEGLSMDPEVGKLPLPAGKSWPIKLNTFALMHTLFPGFSFVAAALPGCPWVALLLMALLDWVWMV
jgi:hypothetical protein